MTGYAAIRPFIAAHRDALQPMTARIVLGAEALSAADAFAGSTGWRSCAAPPSRRGTGSTYRSS